MEQVRLGNTGLKVSKLCLGCMTYGSPDWRPWVLDEDQARPFFKTALEAGVTFFDTANMYSQGRSEEITGKALKDFARRDDLVIATKVFYPMGPGANDRGLSRKHILAQVDASLKRLGTDYIDLYQIHRFDYDTPVEETLEALNDVVRAGKVRYLGASTMFTWQFARMLAIQERNGWARFVSMQPQYNLVYREEEREMLPLCRAQGVGVIPWSPLARGFLAGGRTGPKQGETVRAQSDDLSPKIYFYEEDHRIVDVVSAIAVERGLTNMQVAMAWVLQNPAITAPIVGASKPGHIEQAVSALDVTLSAEEIARLEAPYRPKPLLDRV